MDAAHQLVHLTTQPPLQPLLESSRNAPPHWWEDGGALRDEPNNGWEGDYPQRVREKKSDILYMQLASPCWVCRKDLSTANLLIPPAWQTVRHLPVLLERQHVSQSGHHYSVILFTFIRLAHREVNMQRILAVYPSSRTTQLTSDANDSANAKRHAAPLIGGYFFPMELDI